MSNDINPALQQKVDREVLIKSTTVKAQLGYEKRRYIARGKIAELKELKQINDDYLMEDYE